MPVCENHFIRERSLIAHLARTAEPREAIHNSRHKPLPRVAISPNLYSSQHGTHAARYRLHAPNQASSSAAPPPSPPLHDPLHQHLHHSPHVLGQCDISSHLLRPPLAQHRPCHQPRLDQLPRARPCPRQAHHHAPPPPRTRPSRRRRHRQASRLPMVSPRPAKPDGLVHTAESAHPPRPGPALGTSVG